MKSMTPEYWVVAIVFFIIGLFLCLLFRLAEEKTYWKNGIKKYKKDGKILYFVIYLVLISFVMLMKPMYGLEPYLEIFNESSIYEQGELFSLEGLYNAKMMEPFFMLWVSMVRSITKSETLFLFVSFTYIWSCVIYFSSSFYKKGKFTITFMAMWPVLIDFIFGLRYAMAISTCLLAMIMIKRQRYLVGAILTIVACFTHFLAFAFLLFLCFSIVVTCIFKEKVNSLKVLLLMMVGSVAVTTVGASLFQTFRFAYRMTDTVESSSLMSYAPMVIYALVILYYNKNKKVDFGDNLCSLSSYFNMVMLPVTALWGVYRLPYLFLLPITVELNNVMSQNKKSKMINLTVVAVILIFSLVKIITMGVQNMSLEYSFR